MTRYSTKTNLIASLGLVVLAVIHIVIFADILSNFPIEHDSANRLRGYIDNNNVVSSIIAKDLCIALIAFFLTLFMVGWLEFNGHLAKSQKIIIYTGSALSALLAVFIYPIMSHDIFNYISYGRILGFFGLSPYETTLEKYLADPVISEFPMDWADLTAPYGPIAIFSFAGLNILSKPEPIALLTTFKIFLFIIYIGSFTLAYWLTSKVNVKLPTASLFAYFGNPCVIYMLLIDGHIDGLIIFFLLLCFISLYCNRHIMSWLALGGLCCIKVTMLPLIPLFAAQIFKQPKKEHLSAIAVFIGLIVFCYLITAGGEIKAIYDLTHNINVISRIESFGPIPQLISRFLQNAPLTISCELTHDPELVSMTRKISTGLIFLTLFAIYLTHLLKGSQQTIIVSAGFILLVMAFSGLWYMPWYVLWGWILLLFSPLPLILRFCIVMSGTSLIMIHSFGNHCKASSVFFICVFLTLLTWLLSKYISTKFCRTADQDKPGCI